MGFEHSAFVAAASTSKRLSNVAYCQTAYMHSVAIGANKDAEHLPDGRKVTDQAKLTKKKVSPDKLPNTGSQ